MSPEDHSAPVAPSGLGYVPAGYRPPPEPSRRGRRGLRLAGGVAVAVMLMALAGVAAYRFATRWDGKPHSGDFALTVHAAGRTPDRAELDATTRLVQARLTAAGLTRPTVTVVDVMTLEVTVGPQEDDRARFLLAPGRLTIREVVGNVMDNPGTRPPGTRPPGCPAAERQTDRSGTLGSARAKLGSAYDRAGLITDPASADARSLAAFGTLTCAEVAALAPPMQYAVPTIICAALNGRPPGSVGDQPTQPATACDETGSKLLLARARLTGADIADAGAEESDQNGWQLRLRFTADAQPRWTELTRQASSGTPQKQVAFVLDNKVLVAPTVVAEIPGDAPLTGGAIDEHRARDVAAILDSGPLSIDLSVTSTRPVP